MKRARALLVLLLILAVPAGAEEDLRPALDGIRAEAIRAHMGFLADDLLEGRETGTRGYQLAARYVAAQFEALGMQAAGDEGSFLQCFELRRTSSTASSVTLAFPDGSNEPLVEAQDYVMADNPVWEESEVRAPMVFVGYGVTAEERGYDDYAGVDVQGKVVVLLDGAPPWFPSDERAFYSSRQLKRESATARGAVGYIAFLTAERAATQSWDRMVVNSRIASMRALTEEGEVLGAFPQLRVEARMSQDGARKLFARAPRSLKEINAALKEKPPGSFDLDLECNLTQASRHAKVSSCNVVGVLEGSDPDLRDEFVLYTGHLDHLGVGEPVDGDTIYNGAYDNASGIAVMIEVARAFAGLDHRPGRSILFLAVTGEEKGLLGSEYFADNPTVALDKIAGNINLDMFLMLHPLVDIIAFGAEHSTFQSLVERAVAKLELRLSPDPIPQEVLFIRSDQYSFVKKGIPAIFLVAGLDSGDEDIDGPGQFWRWLRNMYHSQKDDMSQPMDLSAGVRFAQANFLIGLEVASDPQRPRWNPGDFFGERFGKQIE